MSDIRRIEKTLSLHSISTMAMQEKIHKGHPGNLHLWWNRSPVDSSERLIREAVNDGENVVITDPFSGFGGLTLAAERTGLKVLSGDLNSVSVILTKAAAEIPSLFAGVSAVHPGSQAAMYTGTEGLAEDVEYYAKEIQHKLHDDLRKIYQGDGEKETAAWIWTRTVECANPACKCKMPLASSFVLSKKKGMEYWAEPVKDGAQTEFRIHEGECPKDKETNKVGSMGAKFKCPFCGETIMDTYIKEQGTAGKIGMQLMAVAVSEKDGRTFYTPSEAQMKASEVSRNFEAPEGSIPINTRWFSTPAFGMTEFKDLYTDRQLMMLCRLSDLIIECRDRIREDAVSYGMNNDDTSLCEGGCGAKAYAEAVSVYLSLLLGKLTNYHSTICTWDNRKGNLRAAFTRQAIPMTWTFAEGNPFSEITGNHAAILTTIVDAIKSLPCAGKVEVRQQDAVTMEFPDNAVFFTELPYMDNVGYADLSDYFYIWLRRNLKDVYPGIFEKIVSSKEELTSIPEHYGNDAEMARQAYFDGLKNLFTNFRRKAARNCPSMVFYEYSKTDDAVMNGTGRQTDISPFEKITEAIYEAGFQITGVWPVRTEAANEKYENIRIMIVFRCQEDGAQSTRRGWINTLKRELPEELETAFTEEIDADDRLLVAVGKGLSVFSRYKRIMNADGSPMTMQDALGIIRQESEDYLQSHYQSDNAQGINIKEE